MDYANRGPLQQLFMDTLADCSLVLLDVDGRVLTWNAGARAMFGYAETEIVGRHFSCLYAQSDIDADKPAMALAGAVAQGRHEETGRRLRKDGTDVRAVDVLIPLYDPLKKLVAFGNLSRPVNRSLHVVPGLLAAVAAVDGPRKVLLVDDDQAVRDVAVGLLKSLGYEVVVASSGLEALAALGRSADIDVLFTDVKMPDGMSGGELAEQARRLRPDLKILFASGYFEGALVRSGDISASTHFLVKPYRKKDLALKMDEVLNAEAVPA
jgi:PAS domain S-box-containing protein